MGVISLGCPKNLVDSEVMLGLAQKAGWEITNDEAQAEVLLINTCCFIAPAEVEAAEEIRRAVAKKRRREIRGLIVAGCLPQRYGKDLAEEFPDVDAFLGTANFQTLPAVLAKLEHPSRRRLSWATQARASFLYDDTTPRLRATPGPFAYSKIAEGCSRHCSFCIIPRLRGPQHSRAIDSVVQEAADLAAQGVQELNLIAQDLTAYGSELRPPLSLTELLEKLEAASTPPWIRLLYNYPDRFDERLIAAIAASKKVLPYLDLPLQHIDDAILTAMRREVSAAEIAALLDRLRSAIPGLTLRTTLLVGFPGETEQAFARLCDFVRRQRFDHLGVFPFSVEEGTRAAKLPGQVPEAERVRRAEEVMRIQEEIVAEKQRQRRGQPLSVLVLGPSGRSDYPFFGRSQAQAPQIDGVTFLRGGEMAAGQILTAALEGNEAFDGLAYTLKK